MGGEAAKERRRLKRLQAQRQEADSKARNLAGGTTAEVAVSVDTEQKSDAPTPTPNQRISLFEKNSADVVRVRLERKIARKASGKFKAQSEGMPGSNLEKKRKSERIDSKLNGRSNRNTAVQKKKINGKLKSKKPKHLKRKMEQLSRSILDESGGAGAGANSVSVLQDQMKKLMDQMEEYKKFKQKNVVVKEEVMHYIESSKGSDGIKGKEKRNSHNTQPDGNQGRTESIERKDCCRYADPSPSENTVYVEDTHPTKSGTRESTPTVSSSNSSSSHDDGISNHPTARSRGKRRRGRRDHKVEKQRSEGNGSDANEAKTVSKATEEVCSRVKEANETPSASPETEALQPREKTTKKDDKRRCIGRKPVTDFVVGSSYSGKVRYVKPELGAFIDIGCHSDAFCHISCVSDEFVLSVTDVLQADDLVDNVRVLEVNREKKRITVSLRSKDKAKNECEKLKFAKRQEGGQNAHGNHGDVDLSTNNALPEKSHVRFGSELRTSGNSLSLSTKSGSEDVTFQRAGSLKQGADLKRERKLARRAERRAQRGLKTLPPPIGGCTKSRGELPAEKSKTDLKRERKLARRAERRAEREAANKKMKTCN